MSCKEVYRFPHITYTYVLLLYLLFFCSSIPTFCSLFKMLFVLVPVHSVIYLIIFLHSINKHKGDYGRPTEVV